MVSKQQLKKIMQGDGKQITDEQISRLRDMLYILGNIDYEFIKRERGER